MDFLDLKITNKPITLYDMTNNAKNKDELNVDKATIVFFICRHIFILGNTGRQPKPALLKK